MYPQEPAEGQEHDFKYHCEHGRNADCNCIGWKYEMSVVQGHKLINMGYFSATLP